MDINNVQQAIALVHAVGEDYQSQILDTLKSLTLDKTENEQEIKFQRTIDKIASKYALEVANGLYKSCYEDIPIYIKDWNK